MSYNKLYKDDIVYITQLTRNVLSVLGVWPSSNRARSTGERVFKFLLICVSYTLLYGVLIPGILFWLIEKRTRIKIQTFPFLLYCFMATSKYGNLIFRENQVRRCLKHIEEDWKIVTNAEARDTMIESARTGRRLVALCGAFMYGSGLSFRLILPFAKGKIVTAQNITIKPLPCPGYFFSFNSQVSPIYEMIFAMQFLSGLVTYSITTGVCGLAAVFVMHACGQLRILIDLMKRLVEDQLQEKQEVDRRLAEVVEHQIRIRNFLRLVEHTLQQICLIELMGCTIIVCNLGYCIIVAEEVANTSCELEWYRLPDKKARGIVLVIIMSNLPTKITAGKIMDLSLKTFGDVVKTAVTYFNMLRNVTD